MDLICIRQRKEMLPLDTVCCKQWQCLFYCFNSAHSMSPRCTLFNVALVLEKQRRQAPKHSCAAFKEKCFLNGGRECEITRLEQTGSSRRERRGEKKSTGNRERYAIPTAMNGAYNRFRSVHLTLPHLPPPPASHTMLLPRGASSDMKAGGRLASNNTTPLSSPALSGRVTEIPKRWGPA